MTVPPLPSLPLPTAGPPPVGPLGEPGPGQGSWLVHFCGRPPGTGVNPALPPDVAAMRPDERLSNILWEQSIRGTAPWRPGRNAVSFSEVSPPHLYWLVAFRQFPAWALVYDRQAIFNAGGGPVWYARPEQMAAVRAAGLDEWAVRFDTTPGQRSDWAHEQEWRVPCESWPATREAGLLAVLVGDPAWHPQPRYFSAPTGNLLCADGTPATDPAEGVHPEMRLQWWSPPGWPVWRMIPNYATGRVDSLPFQ